MRSRTGYPVFMSEAPKQDYEQEENAEDRPGEPGAEGGSDSPAADRLPGAPAGADYFFGLSRRGEHAPDTADAPGSPQGAASSHARRLV